MTNSKIERIYCMMEKINRQGHHNRRGVAPVVGALVIIMSFIGILTLIASGYRMTTKILDNTKQKEKFEKIIAPVMMLDPIPFTDPIELDNETLLRASLWSTLSEKKETYSVSDQGQMIVPVSDIDVAAANLFGNKVEIKHKSFSEGLMTNYIYDEETMTYNVPIDARAGYYIPKVIDIGKSGDNYSLLVGYIPPGDGWAMNLEGKKREAEPTKYMVYTLNKKDKNYTLVSIKDPESGAIPGIPVQGVQEKEPIQQDKNTESEAKQQSSPTENKEA